MTINISRYQWISVNRFILIIDDQSMAKIRVVIDWYRLSIPSRSLNCYRLVSIDCRLTEKTLYAVIVNTLHYSVNRKTILPSFFLFVCYSPGGGGYSQKNWVGVCGPLPKTPIIFMAKICDISYPIYDLTKNSKPCL